MAEWVGGELEREELLAARRRAGRPGPAPPSGRGAPARRRPVVGIDLNEVVERLERRLRRTLGPEIELVLDLAPGLDPAREARLPLEAIVMALARKAAESMGAGGKLAIATANQELAREPGVLPALAPDRYVTLSVSETSGTVDGDAFARVFAVEETVAEDRPLPQGETRLSLPTVYRMLQRVGGDLSVQVETGRSSTFTLFLPSAPGTGEALLSSESQALAGATPSGH
jgi:signal transduction histidine kinase